MNVIASPEERDKVKRELKARILNVLPAATYHMDRFLSIVDLTLSEEISSAAVEVGHQPVMHLNPHFVREYCKLDEHLLMLVMHELYHVILGHTRLFPRPTLQHNLAFDALINAMLCHQFPDPGYVGFFRRINPVNQFPGRLLRPPTGWPRMMHFAKDAGEKERAVMIRLYGPGFRHATYAEIFDLLRSALPDGVEEDCVLIGDHDGPGESGYFDASAVADTVFSSILGEVAADWPQQTRQELARGLGCNVTDYLMPRPQTPRADFLKALKRFLERAGCLRHRGYSAYAWKNQQSSEEFSSVLPNWRDRRVEGWRAANGEPPVIYRSELARLRRRWTPLDAAHVYLDISGSMSNCLPWLTSALHPLERRGLCRLFVFSTVVDEIRRGRLMRQSVRNTYGTDINCVYEHVLGLPRAVRPQRVAVITDGMTGGVNRPLADRAAALGIDLSVGLVGYAYAADLTPYAKVIEHLPALR